ncbi:MAG: FMN-binding negative transcriptional regulator [Pseudomonadota bacterium]
MFQPPVFAEDRVDVMHDLMRAHPFATIVSQLNGELTADHVPLVLDTANGTYGTLQGHFAVGNPLFRNADGPIDVLTIFQGPQTYVTPSWYPSKQEHGKVVPTWNYVVVHARGTLEFNRDPAFLMNHLHALTDQHESHRETPWSVSDAPDEFVARQLRGLVGFEIALTDMQGKWKISQNRPPKDQSGVEQGLAQSGDPDSVEIAKLVAERTKP